MIRYHHGLGLALFLASLFLVQPATFSDVNPADLVVIDTISLTNPPDEGRPLYVSLTPDGSKLYVVISNPTPRLEVINTATNTVVGGIPLDSGGYPLDLVMAPDGARAYLVRSDSRIHVIDTATDSIVDTIFVPNSSPRDAIISLDSTTLYMGDVKTPLGMVHVIDTASGGVLTTIPLGAMGGARWPFFCGMDITPDGTRIYTASRAYAAVKVIDTLTNSVFATIPVSLTPSHILTEVEITPDGTRAYITITNDSRISVIDTDPGSLTYNQEIDVIDTGWDEYGNPRALTVLDITEDGNLGFVANGWWPVSGNELLVIDTDPASPDFHTILAVIEVGEVPYGVVVQPLPVAEAYVANGDGTVSVIGLSIIPVDIDIKPGSYPNSINLGSNGNVPVAIFSTDDFDATTVDPLTVILAGASVRIKGKGTPQASASDVDEDGLLDLIVHIDTSALQLSGTGTDAILEGETFDGQKIRGVDTVRIVQE